MKARHLGLTALLLCAGCSGDDDHDVTLAPADAGPTTGDGAQTGAAGTRSSDSTADEDGDGDGDRAQLGPINPTGIADDGWEIPEELLLCGDRACACADGQDNDGDGTADGFDTECTGPNDDDEGSFATGISGDNMDPKWQDCFFDGNSGAGDDGCRYHTDCLTGALPPDHERCSVTQACIDFCAPRTPNGCDCFGCCDVQAVDGEVYSVVISADCDESNLQDCTQCEKTTSACENECAECELCPGKTIDDLPDSCWTTPPDDPPSAGAGGSGGAGGVGGGEPPYECDGGAPVCFAHSDCTAGRYCSFGCCVLIPVE